MTIHEKWIEWMSEIKDTDEGPASKDQLRLCRANFYMGACAAISILRHCPASRLPLIINIITHELKHDNKVNPDGELE